MNVPTGWKLVPIEPTPEMIKAEVEYWARDGTMYNGGVYRAMLGAAPEYVEVSP